MVLPRSMRDSTSRPPAQDGRTKCTTMIDTTAMFKRPLKTSSSITAGQAAAHGSKGPETVPKSRVDKANQSKKVLPRQRKSAIDHPLAVAFSSSSSAYQDTVLSIGFTSLESVHDAHIARLKALESDAAEFSSKIIKLGDLTLPLADERLTVGYEVAGKKGQKKAAVTLGEQMDKFAKLAMTEDARLKELWKEWEEVTKELVEMEAAVLGSAGPEQNSLEDRTVKTAAAHNKGHHRNSRNAAQHAYSHHEGDDELSTEEDHTRSKGIPLGEHQVIRRGRPMQKTNVSRERASTPPVLASPPSLHQSTPQRHRVNLHNFKNDELQTQVASIKAQLARSSAEAVDRMEREVRESAAREKKILRDILLLLKQEML